MINHQCKKCSYKYSFTEDDLRWSSLNTYCPQCTSSLAVQDFGVRLKDIIDNGPMVYLGTRLIGWAQQKEISFNHHFVNSFVDLTKNGLWAFIPWTENLNFRINDKPASS